jgi:hypothetical protein
VEPYALGQAVLLTRDGTEELGGIAGQFVTPLGILYDVELEASVVKGVLPDELAPATTADVRHALEAHLSHSVSLGNLPVASREVGRLRYLQTRHAMTLRELLAHATEEGFDASAASFSLGAQVGWRDADTWRLASIVGIRARQDGVRYDLDVSGASVTVGESDLRALDDLRTGSSLGLGSRVRFLVPGHEDDADYEASVCGICGKSESPLYDIVFDDGDVFEGVGEEELATCR